MIIYDSTKEQFLSDVENDEIAEKIEEKYLQLIGKPHRAMKTSWNNSMEYMYKVLNDETIPENSGISIEFKIPYTACKIDFLLSGKNELNKSEVIIIELKQWNKIEKVEGQEAQVLTIMGGKPVPTNHPSYQAWSYASLIEDYNEYVQKEQVTLHPCAYLHNYKKQDQDPLTDKDYSYYIEKAPVFVNGDVIKLREFIKKFIKFGDNKEILYKIDNGKIKPSKSLQDSLASMLKGNKEFILIDNQKTFYEIAVKMARESHKDNKKRVLIIEGGPGTGKTVIAINLLVQLTNEEMVCQYATKNSTPRNIYSYKLTKDIRKNRIDNLFKGSGSYVDAKSNEFDVLITDEAHRLNEKSGMFKNKGENQIKEIINASKFSIFFIDENQRIDINDIGKIDEIKKFSKKFKAELEVKKLDSQFRCGGSDGYISWLDDILEVKETANYDGFDLGYDIRIIDDPNELKKLIFDKNKINNKSRILAGYCWNWKTNGKNNPNIFDIEITKHKFAMSWNLGNTTTWAIDPNSVNEVGCIHTSQGIEFDYVGVIIGEDIRYENGKIVTDFTKRAKTDNSLKGIKKIASKDLEKAKKISDEIIKNTYRTLMTRGQKGCFVYCCDESLSKYFKKRLHMFNKY